MDEKRCSLIFTVCFSPDVARSLKVLDLVIGEFDDGLESEIERGDETQIKRKVKNKQSSAINEKIDHIFNELTQEIYIEQKRENRQKSPTRNVFDPLPAPPQNGRKSLGAKEQDGQKEQQDRSRQKRNPSKGGQEDVRHERLKSVEDDRPPPGTVLAAKQSYLHKTKPPPEKRAEVVLYNEGHDDRPKISEKVKVDVHNFVSETSVKRLKSAVGPGLSTTSQPPALVRKEKAVIKELREKVEGKQGKISKFSHHGSTGALDGREERRKEPVGGDSTPERGREGRPAKPRRTTSEAMRLESVTEEVKRHNRLQERRPEEKRGRQERAQRSRSVGNLEQERLREEEEERHKRGLRRSRSRSSRDQLDNWGEEIDQGRSRSRSKSISRSRGEIFDDVTASQQRQELAKREPPRGPVVQAFSRRQFLVQSQNLQPGPPPAALHHGFHSPYVMITCVARR